MATLPRARLLGVLRSGFCPQITAVQPMNVWLLTPCRSLFVSPPPWSNSSLTRATIEPLGLNI